MHKSFRKSGALCLAALLLIGLTFSANASNTTPSGLDISKEVNIVYYLYGQEGVANKDILAQINALLKKDLNCTLEMKYIDWGDIATKYPLLFASGEQFDMVEASPSFVAPYDKLATQGALADITDMLKYVPALTKEIPERYFDYCRVNGRVYGVPTMYIAFNAYGLVTRQDIQDKYGIAEINSFETAEQYFDACLTEGLVPLNGNSSLADTLYRTFLATSPWWHEVPGISQGELTFAAESAENKTNVFHPAYTDEFAAFVERMKSWADKGYWPVDVMAAPKTAKDNFLAGNSGAFITHQPDWTGAYAAIKEGIGEVKTNFWCYTLHNGKMKRMPPTENICAISSTSANPERTLAVIEKFMTDEAYYRLLQFGIEGRQYEIVEGIVSTPASFDETVDLGGFASWSLRNGHFNLTYSSEDPRRAVQNLEWDKTAIDDPYIGFAFDSSNVSTELAAITNVNAVYGVPLLLGKSTLPVNEAVEEYRTLLTRAGVDKVLAELKGQLEAYVAK